MNDDAGGAVDRAGERQSAGGATTLADLVSAARPGYWTRHVFILPGLLAAVVLTNEPVDRLWIAAALGFASACLVASANYVLNEWLDAAFDRQHPLKRSRPAASGRLTAGVVYLEYAVLAVAGLSLAALVSRPFLVTSLLLLGSGIVYNVWPLRTKERVHLDVLTEAINNPLRLLLGWFMVSSTTVPPLSLILLYWCGGAFLMATKRLAEYRFLFETAGPDAPGRYRKSFERYDQNLLMVVCFLYGILTSFSLAVFLIKYRAEFVLAVPLFAWLFAYYLSDALGDTEAVQSPEPFYRRRGLVFIVLALVVLVTILTVVDIPVLEEVIQSRFPAIHLGR
jgi:decaprenyl-phosphate phosphoribosyltransferase